VEIIRYRTIGAIYPWLSLECEVVDGDDKYYANISVNKDGEPETLIEDARWCYSKPMDTIGVDESGNDIDYDIDYANSLREVPEEIYVQMLEFWNSNPVFVNDKNWKDWPSREQSPERE